MRLTQAMVNEFVVDAIAANPVMSAALDAQQLVLRSSERSITIRLVTRGGSMQDLARELRALRSRTGRSQADVAHELGVSQSSIIRMFNGETFPKWPTVSVAVTYLGGDVNYFRQVWDEAQEQERQRQLEDK